MEYYHNLITQKSWEELQKLRSTVDFVLIGGWAVYLYTKTLKSKDIDIIIDFDKLSLLKEHYQVLKNNRLNKYEAIREEMQIDIYLPHYSKLGIPVEDLMQNFEHLEGFTVLESNYLMVLKFYTLAQRGRSVKGRKDFIDILALIDSGVVEWNKIWKIVETYELRKSLDTFKDFLNENYEVPELNIKKHQFSKIKKEILRALKS